MTPSITTQRGATTTIMSVSTVVKAGPWLAACLFVSACTQSAESNQQATWAQPVDAEKLSGLRPQSTCEQVYQPTYFSDQTAFKQLAAQLQQWADNQHLSSGRRLTATLTQLPTRPGDRIRARLFVDEVAVWPTTLLLENASGQLAATDPVLMKNLITAQFNAFLANEKDVIDQASVALDPSGQ